MTLFPKLNPCKGFMHMMLFMSTVGICMAKQKFHQKLLHMEFQVKCDDNLKRYMKIHECCTVWSNDNIE